MEFSFFGELCPFFGRIYQKFGFLASSAKIVELIPKAFGRKSASWILTHTYIYYLVKELL